MDNDRQPGGCGQFHLAAENFFLHIARRVIVKIIQADLTPRDQLGMFCQPRHLFVIGFCGYAGFMRMQACAREDPVMLLGDLQRAVISSRAGAAANGKNPLQAGFTCTREHL